MLVSKAMAENGENVIGFIASTVESIRDELTLMRAEMVTRTNFHVTIEGVRGEIEQVQLRLDGIEHSVSSRFEIVEGEISRLRSAVYVLGKDRPDVLRLLGTRSS
jgi:hypothetical protein